MAVLRGKEALQYLAQKRKAKLSAEGGTENARKASKKNSRRGAAGFSSEFAAAVSSRAQGDSSRLGPTNIAIFDAAMAKFEASVDDWGIQFFKDLTHDLFIEIVGFTPVLTGRARANWQIGEHGVPETSIAANSSGGGEIGYPDPIAPALAILAGIQDFRDVVIANNVRYIGDLDGGSSAKAPNGIVDPALAVVSARLGGYIDALDKAVSLEDYASSRGATSIGDIL